MRHHDAKFAASELYDTMSQSWKGEFMDFFTEAVNVLADIVRALSCPDFPEEWKEMFPAKVREAAILPMRIRRLWPPIRAEPGNYRQGQSVME